MNNSGPRIEPCGTPCLTGSGSEISGFRLTLTCDRSRLCSSASFIDTVAARCPTVVRKKALKSLSRTDVSLVYYKC